MWKIDLPLERIGLEACSLTAWLYDGIRAEGLPAIYIETRQANAAMKTMPNKTDRNDARALAQMLRDTLQQVSLFARHLGKSLDGCGANVSRTRQSARPFQRARVFHSC